MAVMSVNGGNPNAEEKTYQGESGLILVQSADTSPVEGLQQFDTRRIERILARHDAEKVGITLARKHRVRVGVRQLVTSAAPFVKQKKFFFFFVIPEKEKRKKKNQNGFIRVAEMVTKATRVGGTDGQNKTNCPAGCHTKKPKKAKKSQKKKEKN